MRFALFILSFVLFRARRSTYSFFLLALVTCYSFLYILYGKNEGGQKIETRVIERETVGNVLMFFCSSLLRQICELRKHIEKSRVNINSIHFCRHVPSWYFLDIFMRSPFALPFLSISSVSLFSFIFFVPLFLYLCLMSLLAHDFFSSTRALVFTLSLELWQQRGRSIRIYVKAASQIFLYFILYFSVAILLCINTYSVRCIYIRTNVHGVRMLHNFRSLKHNQTKQQYNLENLIQLHSNIQVTLCCY